MLLHWLLAHDYRKLIVCHLDHRLRGRSGAGDARFVERLATNHALPFAGGTADVNAIAKEEKRSLEMAARLARLRFFAATAKRRRCHTIFLGHHADDLVETFLFNLFRGAGAQGQRSMQPVSTQRIASAEITLVRPLLSVWRKEIDAYVAAHGLKYREDATNESRGPVRNRMRHEIIPFIEKKFGREVRKSIWRAAAIAEEEDALLESILPNECRSAETLAVSGLRKLPIALQRRAIRALLMQQGVADIGFEVIEAVRDLLEPGASISKVNLPRARYARRREGKLFVE